MPDDLLAELDGLSTWASPPLADPATIDIAVLDDCRVSADGADVYRIE